MNPETAQDAGAKLLRLLRPSIVVLCGPSACGKSTFAKQHFRPTQVISSDWARALVCDDERDQRFNTQAFALVHFLVEQRVTLNRLCVVDSTALTPQARRDLLSLARKCQVPTTLILFHVPLETCLERDQKRERTVGRAIIERQYQSFDLSKDAIRQEGFDNVVEFHGDEAEKVQIEILFRPVQRPQRTDSGPAKRFDRSAPPHDRRPGGNGSKVVTPSRSLANPLPPPPAQAVAESRPVTVSAPVSATRVEAGNGTKATAPMPSAPAGHVAVTPPTHSVHAAATSAGISKKSS